jgi:capsular exopolysaccharide synthesis family protein
MSTINNSNQIAHQELRPSVSFSIKELLFKYLSHLPLIVTVFCISVGAGILYTRYATPIYKASARMFVKNGEENSVYPAGQDSRDVLQMALVGGGKVINLDNEIIRIKAMDLMKQVVRKYGFNINIINLGRFRNSNIYTQAAIRFNVNSVKDSSKSYSLEIRRLGPKGVTIVNGKSIGAPDFIPYGRLIQASDWSFTVLPTGYISSDLDEPYSCTWVPVDAEASRIAGKLNAVAYSKTTSILQLELRTDNPIRGMDILNALVTEYSRNNVETKKISARNTIGFIDDRLALLSKELAEEDEKLVALRKDGNMLDLATYKERMMKKLSESDDKLDNLKINSLLIELLRDYMNSPAKVDSLIPVNIGLDNSMLTVNIAKYNELLLKRKREKQFNTDNIVVRDLDIQLKNLKLTIDQNLLNLKKANESLLNEYYSKRASLDKEASTIPDKEKVLKDILGKVNIKNELFLYLLKKREETAITSSTTLSNYEQIDKAAASFIPIEPKTENIRNFSILIGLVLPLLLIYMIDLFNDKITTKEEIQKKLNISIAGEVSHISNDKDFVFAFNRHLVSEQFRLLRTNLQFLLHDNSGSKVIMITSTMSGEGKSFISSNLAVGLSLLNKKVAFLQYDLRKGKTSPAMELHYSKYQSNKGIVNYLIGQTDDIKGLSVRSSEYPNLDVYFSGPIPPNPTELLTGERAKRIINDLRRDYDYIIIDSAPVGLVSDAFLCAEHADLVLYILRQRFTLKKQMEYIAEVKHSEKFKSLALVINDVVVGGRYGYYGYNYSYGYGYASMYGYGYKYTNLYQKGNGYVDEIDIQLPWWIRFTRFLNRFSKRKN